MNKKGLGKGLGAIFGDAADPVNTAVEPVRSDEEKKELLLKDIVPNPHQPRQVFDAAKLAELVESIKLHGVIQPLVVRKHGRKYEIVTPTIFPSATVISHKHPVTSSAIFPLLNFFILPYILAVIVLSSILVTYTFL